MGLMQKFCKISIRRRRVTDDAACQDGLIEPGC
jgi:hypothetical protein